MKNTRGTDKKTLATKIVPTKTLNPNTYLPDILYRAGTFCETIRKQNFLPKYVDMFPLEWHALYELL